MCDECLSLKREIEDLKFENEILKIKISNLMDEIDELECEY